MNKLTFSLDEQATQALVNWAKSVSDSAETPFDAAQAIMPRLGANWVDGRAEVGFWTPVIAENGIPSAQIWLELLTPRNEIDFSKDEQQIEFDSQRVNLVREGEYCWGVVKGMQAGSHEQVGAFYRLVYQNASGDEKIILDPLAQSLPFGAFAPAEFYDIAGMQAGRTDKTHFQNLDYDLRYAHEGIPRISTPTNILQIHVNTASEEGTLAGLTRIYNTIAEKIRNDDPLTPAEQNYIGYDAVQLMPIEPTIELEAGPAFWQEEKSDGGLTVTLLKPHQTNWGYDVVLLGSPSTNPAVLGSKRPDELLDFIAALHNFPVKPIMFMLDIVYGHIDNQALPILNDYFFAGANMYGQNVRFSHPVVRAMLLEMMRRKHNYGVDGIRVDGAQDFKNYNPETNEMEHDDAFIELMNNVVLDVAGVRYLPWMIFEDGRPWPREDWELASNYRVITGNLPNVFQWGPLTFAHNTPFLFTFWISKWWRIREMTQVGSKWITGCANHDTLRRGTQVAIDARVNQYLGQTLPEIFEKAYDNPAAKLFDYAVMPGVPMDFINASIRTPWGFIRNTDDRYGVKVVSEEARLLYWTMTDARWENPQTFPRLKAMGFTSLSGLRKFMLALDHTAQAADYDNDIIAAMLNTMGLDAPALSTSVLKQIARAWMDDVHEYCNVSLYADAVDVGRSGYSLKMREFRRARPWLKEDLRSDEHFDYRYPSEGTVLFYGLRVSPEGYDHEKLFFIANMEGAPRTIIPLGLPIPALADLPKSRWEVALSTPGLNVTDISAPLTLQDSEGVVFRLVD